MSSLLATSAINESDSADVKRSSADRSSCVLLSSDARARAIQREMVEGLTRYILDNLSIPAPPTTCRWNTVRSRVGSSVQARASACFTSGRASPRMTADSPAQS
jgi:hypothetical protein